MITSITTPSLNIPSEIRVVAQRSIEQARDQAHAMARTRGFDDGGFAPLTPVRPA